MRNPRTWTRLLAMAFVLIAANVSHAVITALTPLKAFQSDAQFIVVAKVDKLYPEKPAMMLVVTDDLKGKTPFRQLPMSLTGDKEAAKDKHTEVMLKRLAPDQSVILFINQRGKVLTTFGFTNGTWFQVIGKATTADTAAWSFTHCEPYLRRTFKGTTAELQGLLKESLAGKKELPAPDEKEPPGYGPEVPQKKSDAGRGTSFRLAEGERPNGRTLWAVIPTLGVGGPLAILALLFPSVFGGVLVLFRQWAAFFTLISLISLAYVVREFFPGWMQGTALTSEGGWWFMLTAMTFACALWSWRRYIHWAADPALYPSTKMTEVVMLWVMTVSCAAMLLVWYYVPEKPPSDLDLDWNLFLIFSGAIALSTLYTSYRIIVGNFRFTPALPSEGIILFAALFGFTGVSAARWGGGAPVSVSAEQGQQATGGGHSAAFIGIAWEFRSKENGLIVSSARVDGDHVYIASAHPTFKFGNLYCVERKTGKEVWRFDDEGGFRQAFSTPHVADGRLYIGEGWHEDKNCKLYCLDLNTIDAETKAPKKLWEFQTESQTEASPTVADGKVYFGGGNDGFYCCDALTGKKQWKFPDTPGPRLLRFGAGAAVADGRVFVGTGVDRLIEENDKGETALFCLNAGSGKEMWRVSIKDPEYPCWAAPVVRGVHVYFGVGNGDIFTDDKKPGGAVLCLETASGKQVWRVDVPNGVLEHPAVDEDHVYFTCRDGYCYCLDRRDGKRKWRTPMGSPIFAAPALAACSGCGNTAAVYVAATDGRIACLEARTGKEQWSTQLPEKRSPFLGATPAVVVLREKDGDRRRLYLGAGLDIDPRNLSLGKAVLFCLEDRVGGGQ
jgi:outer membrane protein assembly factor BamB